jgi:pimeloyl-ACP methyl ester carboxylesterase
MILEKFLFPAPNPPDYTLTSHGKHLFWLPSDRYSIETSSIPCMLYSPLREARFFIIWCHGNACDIGTMNMTFKAISQRLQAHVLIFEYPSYGLLNKITSPPTEVSINNHAQCAYSFVRDKFKWPTNRIIIYGHSIGSGAACHLASTQPVGGLILQSPFISINNLIQEKIGILSRLINSSFWDNYQAMKYITCPILFIHGQRDKLIPSHHSQTLFYSFNYTNNKELKLLPNDDHNSISDTIILMHAEAFINKYFRPITVSRRRVKTVSVLRQPPHINFK